MTDKSISIFNRVIGTSNVEDLHHIKDEITRLYDSKGIEQNELNMLYLVVQTKDNELSILYILDIIKRMATKKTNNKDSPIIQKKETLH